LRRQISHIGEMVDGCLIEPGEGGNQIKPFGQRPAMKARNACAAIGALPKTRHSSPIVSSKLVLTFDARTVPGDGHAARNALHI